MEIVFLQINHEQCDTLNMEKKFKQGCKKKKSL